MGPLLAWQAALYVTPAAAWAAGGGWKFSARRIWRERMLNFSNTTVPAGWNPPHSRMSAASSS